MIEVKLLPIDTLFDFVIFFFELLFLSVTCFHFKQKNLTSFETRHSFQMLITNESLALILLNHVKMNKIKIAYAKLNNK